MRVYLWASKADAERCIRKNGLQNSFAIVPVKLDTYNPRITELKLNVTDSDGNITNGREDDYEKSGMVKKKNGDGTLQVDLDR